MIQTIVPVNVSGEDLAAITTERDPNATAPTLPDASQLTLKDLGNWQQDSYELSVAMAGSVGFPLWSASTDNHVKCMVFGVSRFTDLRSGGHIFRYGIAIRVFLEMLDVKGDTKFSLPAIAAQVELGLIQSNSELIIRGFTGDLGPLMPEWQEFDVNSYARFMEKVNTIQTKIFSDPDSAQPRLLSSTLAHETVDDGDHARKSRWF